MSFLNTESGQSAQTAPGAVPETGTVIITALNFGTIINGGGGGNAPGVFVNVTYAPGIAAQISSVRVELRAPDGEIVSEVADANDNENLEQLFVGLRSQSISGNYEISGIRISFAGDPLVTGLPEDGLTLGADQISSLIPSRFIEFDNPDQDITPPEVSDLLLPTRSILVDNDLPGVLGGGESAEITFQGTFTDENSGLNIIEFEFDIGPGSPAVIGASVGIFGDLSQGVKQLSTFNTEAPAGKYVFELLRVSDDQGNTTLLTADDLAGLGYQNSVQIVSPEDLQDATSPTVDSLSLDSNEVVVGTNGASLKVSLVASDSGFGATGVQTATIVLISTLGSRYQLDAEVVFSDSDNGAAIFDFPRDFPTGDFTIERLSINDAAFNRQDVTVDDMSLSVTNAEGGDIAANRLVGDATDNVIVARSGNDTVIGGAGSDRLLLGRGEDVSFAGPGDTGNDSVVGGSGDDLIGAGGGDDLVIGGQLIEVDAQTLLSRSLEERLDGSDTLFGGEGNDTIYGGSPRFIVDEQGATTVSDFGSIASNVIYAGTGDDVVFGSYGDDTLGGGTGADALAGADGNDVIYGGRGDQSAEGVNDVISGGTGNDAVFASGGNDLVNGGADNDTLFGGTGKDTLNAGGGHDHIYGGTGDDILSGGTGNDVFYFLPGSGADTVIDFDLSADTIDFSDYNVRFSSLTALKANAVATVVAGQVGLLFDLGEGDQVFLHDVTNVNDVNIDF